MIFPFVALNYQRVQSSFPLFPAAHCQRDHHLRPSQGFGRYTSPPFVVEQPSPWDHHGVGTMNSTPAVYVESLERGYRFATPLSKEHDKETQWMVGCLYIYCIYIYIISLLLLQYIQYPAVIYVLLRFLAQILQSSGFCYGLGRQSVAPKPIKSSRSRAWKSMPESGRGRLPRRNQWPAQGRSHDHGHINSKWWIMTNLLWW